MKRLYIIAFLILISVLANHAFAQKETLFDEGFNSGGYGAPVIKFSRVNGNFAILAGGRGAWVVNNRFTLGGGGYGLVNEIRGKNTDKLMMFGYGGGELGYFFNPNKLIHFYFNLFIGAGSVSYRYKNERESGSSANVFVLDPSVQLMINVTHFFKIGIGGSYRYVSNPGYGDLKSSDLSYPSGEISFNFGSF